MTIDQQRQRVEQEMTRMVDDLDRSTMRKMQVNVQNDMQLHNILFIENKYECNSEC